MNKKSSQHRRERARSGAVYAVTIHGSAAQDKIPDDPRPAPRFPADDQRLPVGGSGQILFHAGGKWQVVASGRQSRRLLFVRRALPSLLVDVAIPIMRSCKPLRRTVSWGFSVFRAKPVPGREFFPGSVVGVAIWHARQTWKLKNCWLGFVAETPRPQRNSSRDTGRVCAGWSRPGRTSGWRVALTPRMWCRTR